MYSISDYGRMIGDPGRLEAYAEAMRRVITPGSVVADIGAGTGIFSVLACKLGARRVYAIEAGGAVSVLREIVAENGCSDRVECIAALSTEITLPYPADVIVADLRGGLPIFGNNIAAMIDARERHLAPGGTLIPASDEVRCAVVGAPRLFRRLIGPWAPESGVRLTPMQRYVTNGLYRAPVDEVELLSASRTWCTLDYRTVKQTRVSGNIELPLEQAGTAHGFVQWFDCTTVPGVGFSNQPKARPDNVYHPTYFPWPVAVQLAADDVVTVAWHADPVGEDYVWRWDTVIHNAAGETRMDFRQSSFFCSPIETETLPSRARDHRPSLNEKGGLDHFVLQHMDGKWTLDAIAAELFQRYPKRFTRHQQALDYVAELSVKYSLRAAKQEGPQ